MKDSQVQTGRQSVFRVDDCFIDNIKEVHPYSDVLEGLCKGLTFLLGAFPARNDGVEGDCSQECSLKEKRPKGPFWQIPRCVCL